MNEYSVSTIIALADNNMKPTEAAYSLRVHRNTILYRIEMIKRATGLDPLNFYDLHKLVKMVEGEKRTDG